jgi:hypothetical protein
LFLMKPVRGAANEHGCSQAITWLCDRSRGIQQNRCVRANGRSMARSTTGVSGCRGYQRWQGRVSAVVAVVLGENGAVLGYYGACSGNYLKTFRDRQIILKRQ